jgi:hypothetical protein
MPSMVATVTPLPMSAVATSDPELAKAAAQQQRQGQASRPSSNKPSIRARL